jgi:hypothetical protein
MFGRKAPWFEITDYLPHSSRSKMGSPTRVGCAADDVERDVFTRKEPCAGSIPAASVIITLG